MSNRAAAASCWSSGAENMGIFQRETGPSAGLKRARTSALAGSLPCATPAQAAPRPSLFSSRCPGGHSLYQSLLTPCQRPGRQDGGKNRKTGERAIRQRLPNIREESMVMRVDVDVQQLWQDYRAHPTVELRNQLVENYLPLVKYNAERIWARLPEGVELDDLVSAGVFGLWMPLKRSISTVASS